MMRLSLLWAAGISVVLTACGGGGGDSGTTGGTNTSTSSKTYTVGGQVAALNAPGLVLQLNNDSDLVVEAFNPSFVFTKALKEGSQYTVSVRTNPVGQICNIEKNATGLVSATSLLAIAVKCTTPLQSTDYTVGGSVSGLTAAGLALTNGSEQIIVSPNATQFQFSTPLKTGASYDVDIETQPAGLTCTLLNNSGLVNKNPITTVSINCFPAQIKPGFSLNKTKVEFVAEQGVFLAEQTLIGTITGVTEPVDVFVERTQNAIRRAYFKPVSDDSGQLVIVPKYTALNPGVINDSITVKVCYQTDTKCSKPILDTPKTIPVVTEIKSTKPAPNLVLSTYGIAFTSVPTQEKLSQTLKVTQSLGEDINWAASSNQPWLTVTTAGKSTDVLIVKANKTGLAAGQYYAEVTVSSSSSGLSAQKVRVGLYVSTTVSAQNFVPEIDDERVSLYVDPIRPLVYSIVSYTIETTAEGSKDKPFEILVHNIYTGSRVAKIKIPAGRYGYDMGLAISSDGSYLYATDTIDDVIDVFSLDTLKRVKTFDFNAYVRPVDNRNTRMVYSHVQGRPVIALNNFNMNLQGNNYFDALGDDSVFLDALTGEVIGQLSYVSANVTIGGNRFFVISADGNVLYQSVYGLSGYLPPAKRFDLKVNSKGNVYGVETANTGDLNGDSPFIFSTNKDGSKAYTNTSKILENVGGILKQKVMPPFGNREFVTSGFDRDGGFLCSVFDNEGFSAYMEVIDEDFKSIRQFKWIDGLGGMSHVYFSSDGLKVFNRSNIRNY